MKIIIYPIKQNHLHTYLYFEKGRDIYLNKNKKQKRKKKTNTFFIQIDKKNAL
tara:strand:+ start:4479 stop:4637 length:159 start_codon:yes stop_codon:yes gene_type:complete